MSIKYSSKHIHQSCSQDYFWKSKKSWMRIKYNQAGFKFQGQWIYKVQSIFLNIFKLYTNSSVSSNSSYHSSGPKGLDVVKVSKSIIYYFKLICCLFTCLLELSIKPLMKTWALTLLGPWHFKNIIQPPHPDLSSIITGRNGNSSV